MCCFTGPVESVSNTRIFARLSSDGRQSLIYQMAMQSKKEVAMVLPVPVLPGSGEQALSFYSFEAYPSFFHDLAKGFPSPSRAKSAGRVLPMTVYSVPKLEVHSVGAFEASFVPGVADFSRLDKRFRLPDQVWEKLPGYRDFGFAVFKLKKGRNETHPMAFTFPTARPRQLFFPTLHIHDGEVHDQESFDHTLYAQGRGLNFSRWQESRQLAENFVKTPQAHGMVAEGRHVHRRQLSGLLANGDIVVKPWI